MLVSIVIRTYNEEKHLEELLASINKQERDAYTIEVVLVDSGSTDRTLDIATQYECNIVHIEREEFSFGRSLNMGCEAAKGDYLVFVSGHCIPTDENWIKNLVKPFDEEKIAYTYGKQIGNELNKFSEHRIFEKFYPKKSNIPQDDFFCNNANSALRKSVWFEHKFDEDLTGLEDMELAKRLVNNGMQIAYVADAAVVHIHEETWSKVRIRYEREAIALQKIMPEVHISPVDAIRYFLSSLFFDFSVSIQERCFWRNIGSIVMFRLMQYWGTYKGNHEHRKLSHRLKENYFYPK